MISTPRHVIEGIVISALRELSDERFQRRVWVVGSSTEMSSLNEATAALYNDSGMDDALEKNVTTFSEDTDQELRELRKMLKKALAQRSRSGTEATIGSSDWEAVRKKARRILEAVANQ